MIADIILEGIPYVAYGNLSEQTWIHSLVLSLSTQYSKPMCPG